jgi:hypothetical protein
MFYEKGKIKGSKISESSPITRQEQQNASPCTQLLDYPYHSWAFAEVFLDELWSHDPDEGGGGVVSDCFRQHSLSAA